MSASANALAPRLYQISYLTRDMDATQGWFKRVMGVRHFGTFDTFLGPDYNFRMRGKTHPGIKIKVAMARVGARRIRTGNHRARTGRQHLFRVSRKVWTGPSSCGLRGAGFRPGGGAGARRGNAAIDRIRKCRRQGRILRLESRGRLGDRNRTVQQGDRRGTRSAQDSARGHHRRFRRAGAALLSGRLSGPRFQRRRRFLQTRDRG